MVIGLQRASTPSNLFMHITLHVHGQRLFPFTLTSSAILGLSNLGLKRTGSLVSISCLLECSFSEPTHRTLRRSKGNAQRGDPHKEGLWSQLNPHPGATHVSVGIFTSQSCWHPGQHQVKQKTHQSTTDLKLLSFGVACYTESYLLHCLLINYIKNSFIYPKIMSFKFQMFPQFYNSETHFSCSLFLNLQILSLKNNTK